MKFSFKIWFPPERKVYSGSRNVWKMENFMKMENRQKNGARARMKNSLKDTFQLDVKTWCHC